MIKLLYLTLGVSLLILLGESGAVEKKTDNPQIENEQLKFRLTPRTREQTAAFYEGRGFPKSAINRIAKSCFFTVIIRNKSDKVLWLELNNWRFYSDNQPIVRLDRPYWEQQWREINLPQSYRSTFGWTLLPDVRDLQPNEPVGGNIVLPRTREPFTIEALFKTGTNKRGNDIVLRFTNIQCAD
jgi:hypothetical protein